MSVKMNGIPFTGHSDNVRGVTIDQSGNVYSGSWDGDIKKIDSSGNQIWNYNSGGDRIQTLAVDPGTVGAGFWS